MRYLPFAAGLAEIVVFVAVASWIGLGWTLLLAIATSVIGFVLLQRAGLQAWSSLRESVAAGPVVDQFEIRERMAGTGTRMLSAFLLILPGFLTDAFALAILVPTVRKAFGDRLAFSALQTFPPRRGTPRNDGSASRQDVIEGEVVDPDDLNGT